MRRQRFVLLGVAALLVWPAIYSLTHLRRAGALRTLVSQQYRLDKLYRSMEGPMSVEAGLRLNQDSTSSVQWITGVETQVVDAVEQKPVSQEFFCHSNLTFAENGATPAQYNRQLGGKTHLDARLFTLVPGRMSIQLPAGFGVPVPADAPLDYVTMSLNLNPRSQPIDVRMRTKLHTIAAGEPDAPSKALFRRALYVLQPRNGTGSRPICMAGATQHSGAGCAEFQPAAGLTNHWIVARGRHVYTTEITPQLNLPFDTTVHYATMHVHPFARAMELRDLTTGAVVMRLGSQDWPDRLGVAHVDELKSIEGVPIHRDHRYELTVEYDNTSPAETDAMAILYLYLLEKQLT